MNSIHDGIYASGLVTKYRNRKVYTTVKAHLSAEIDVHNKNHHPLMFGMERTTRREVMGPLFASGSHLESSLTQFR